MARKTDETTDTKRPVGRPSKYSPAYCEEVIACMGKGYSFTAFAGEIGVDKDTLYEWVKVHPEFSDAVKKARAKRLRCLEEKLLNGDTGPRVTAMIFALKNADAEEWRDKVTNEHSGPDGKPIETDGSLRIEFVPTKRSDGNGS